MASVSFLLPRSTHDQLHDLSKRRTKTQSLIAAVNEYAGEPLVADKTSPSGYELPEDVVARLDQIKERNNLKSRNQAIALLIDLAWRKAQRSQQADAQNNT